MALRILLLASSPELRLLVEQAFQNDGEVQLAGSTQEAGEAVAMARALQPDLVLVEPQLGGLESAAAVREIMIEAPAPVVVVARDSDPDLGSPAVDALAAGALAIIPAPLKNGAEPDEAAQRKFLSSLKAMSQVKVVRRWRRLQDSPPPSTQHAARIVGIVASTGGPTAVQAILAGLPPNFSAPILVVQHISTGFIDMVAASLDAAVPLRVKVAKDAEPLRPGTVYLAPEGCQLGVSGRTFIHVIEARPTDRLRPSGSYLFSSLAHTFGRDVLAVVLTGMGDDGTQGLRDIRATKGTAIAQDAETSVVFGMPKAAIEAGLVDHVLPLGEIAGKITTLAGGAAR